MVPVARLSRSWATLSPASKNCHQQQMTVAPMSHLNPWPGRLYFSCGPRCGCCMLALSGPHCLALGEGNAFSCKNWLCPGRLCLLTSASWRAPHNTTDLCASTHRTPLRAPKAQTCLISDLQRLNLWPHTIIRTAMQACGVFKVSEADTCEMMEILSPTQTAKRQGTRPSLCGTTCRILLGTRSCASARARKCRSTGHLVICESHIGPEAECSKKCTENDESRCIRVRGSVHANQ
mmetsp:Transcript_40502/g.86442  ORF Transcript_40502/g.86442 Transcript_40502/m.86442 type:complete len:235 (-) Transcript_40502:266-970(-)